MIRLLHITLIFLILIRFEAIANIDSLQTLLKERNFVQVNKYIHALNNEKNTSTAYLSYDEFIDSIYTATIQVQTWKTIDSVGISEVHRYSINLVIDDTSIIFCKMFDNGIALLINNFEEITPVLIINYSNEITIKELIKKKYPYQSNSHNTDDLFSNFVLYGYSCGYFGKTLKSRLIMEYLVDKLDTNSLFTWLFAPTIEQQVFAIEGFYLLKKKGIKITDQQSQMIMLIKNKTGDVRICGGCIMSARSIQEVCKKFKFKKRKKKKK